MMSPVQKSKLSECLEQLARDKGDQEAWRQVYGLLWTRVMSTTYRALGGLRDRSEDASQEVFFRLARYTDFSRVRTADEFLGYVSVVCDNVAADFLKELVNTTVSLEEGLDDEQQESLTPANPEQLVISEDLLRSFETGLNAEERELLKLVRDGYTDSEIAAHFGWSYGKAGIRVYRLRIKIRKHMKQKGL
jgi:RNA polymerase sigma factor (sigma-70 family)